MLSNTLNTNEIKDSAGTEVEFDRLSSVDRKTIYKKITETPNLPYRMTISHQEIGVGSELRRRSVVRFDKTVAGVSLNPRAVSAYAVVDAPVGDMATDADIAHVVANLLSFCATTGAATTVLFDGTGLGATALIKGSL